MKDLPDYPLMTRVVDAAIAVPSQSIRSYVDSLRVKYPRASPDQIIGHLERKYMLALTGSGGAVGAAAAWPGIGTGVAVVLTGSQVGTFMAASAALAFAVADVHGVEVTDVDRRKTLLLTTLLGDRGPDILEQQLGLGTMNWGRTLLARMPVATVKSVNKALKGRVARGVVTKGGSVIAGRLLPFGIGALIGIAGGRALGKQVLKGLHAAFGAAPIDFKRPLPLIEAAPATHGSYLEGGTSIESV